MNTATSAAFIPWQANGTSPVFNTKPLNVTRCQAWLRSFNKARDLEERGYSVVDVGKLPNGLLFFDFPSTAKYASPTEAMYRVIRNSRGFLTCSCQGFAHNSHCWHIAAYLLIEKPSEEAYIAQVLQALQAKPQEKAQLIEHRAAWLPTTRPAGPRLYR